MNMMMTVILLARIITCTGCIDDAAYSSQMTNVGLSAVFASVCVCVLGTSMSCAKTAEPQVSWFGIDSGEPKEPCIR